MAGIKLRDVFYVLGLKVLICLPEGLRLVLVASHTFWLSFLLLFQPLKQLIVRDRLQIHSDYIT